MAILLGLIVSFGLASALLLFRHRTIPHAKKRSQDYPTISVIIPARNEERNLPHLLESLKKQTIPLHEVIVVDDHSRDRTRSIAESYGVKVLTSPELPAGWTGKSWALWNGYRESSGELLIFLDADVRLSENAIESLVQEQQRQGGVISVVPYHITEKSYERWAMVINLLAAFVFTSPFENRRSTKRDVRCLHRGQPGRLRKNRRPPFHLVGSAGRSSFGSTFSSGGNPGVQLPWLRSHIVPHVSGRVPQ